MKATHRVEVSFASISRSLPASLFLNGKCVLQLVLLLTMYLPASHLKV